MRLRALNRPVGLSALEVEQGKEDANGPGHTTGKPFRKTIAVSIVHLALSLAATVVALHRELPATSSITPQTNP
jgi:hypothetical protein